MFTLSSSNTFLLHCSKNLSFDPVLEKEENGSKGKTLKGTAETVRDIERKIKVREKVEEICMKIEKRDKVEEN